jgi:hypothetical protein
VSTVLVEELGTADATWHARLQPLNQGTARIDRDRGLGRVSTFEGSLADLTPERPDHGVRLPYR